ncbi:riboflavin synthase subunit beta [uncultured Winogradskyella sp.]|uniref:riboflavin synthase subunit beta n=1 Tax=uncultured Winogradskyella sp. TaxID=395353 RepID=UPI0030D71650|tara:strand:+ start:140091 stop:140375 length:285 start_codon:yes stop_codon:yes gene_type:complete
MGLMKLKKNRKYNYTPRYYKGKGSPYELKHKFDDQRKTINTPKGLKGRFDAALDDYQVNKDDNANRRVLIIVSVLVLIFLMIIGFDLSIFFPNS